MSTILGRVKAWLASPEGAQQYEAAEAIAAPKVVTDLAGATHRPFVMTPELRKSMANRIAIAVPTNPADVIDVERMARIQGLPVDILLVLESLAEMAERGNLLAAKLLVEERERLGIDPGKVSYRRS